VSWHETLGNFVGKECIVYTIFKDGSCGVSFEADGVGGGFCWLTSALEPIHEAHSMWWPKIGEEVMLGHERVTIVGAYPVTHKLSTGIDCHVTFLRPVIPTEITPEQAIALLEQHTGKSFTIKSK
jgi:hypothetical protein